MAEQRVVTVLMTTHAVRPALLRGSLSSILCQSFPNFELLVVLSGELGADQETEIARAAQDERVRVIRPGRVGRGRALNIGLDAAAGEFVAIQDSDDESHPLRLEHQLATLKARPDIDLLGTEARRSSDLDGHADWPLGPPPERVDLVGRELLGRNVLVHTSIMGRIDTFRAVGGYDDTRKRFFDYDLYLRARGHGARLARLPEPLVLQRVHKDQYFAAEPAVMERLRNAYQLQFAHARDEPVPARWWCMATICVRVPLRIGRARWRRRRLGDVRRTLPD
ncbi:MAG: glycosyltransferase [Acidimicrobiales bacterium]